MGEKNLQIWADEAKLLRKLSTFVAIISFIFSLVVYFTGIYNTLIPFDSYSLLVVPYLVVSLLALHSAITGYFEEKSAEEEQERMEIERRREKMALDAGDDSIFLARRTLRVYRKYSPYFIAALQIILIAGLLSLFWVHWEKRMKAPDISNVLEGAFSSALLGVVSLFGGIFLIGQSRDRAYRSLRSSGTWLVAVFIVGILASFSMILHRFNHPEWELRIRTISFVFLALLAFETLINFVIDFYRPRSAAEESPIFESRLLAIVTSPGELARNVSDAMEYQFGVSLSLREIRNFAESAIVPLILFWLLSLWLFTCVAEVKINEIGVREFFGIRQNPPYLKAGIHFKAPWPIGKISRFPVHEIQEIIVGPELKDEKGKELDAEIVIWTKQHYAKEPRFLVASEKEGRGTEAPVSFLAAVFPIQFKIKEDAVLDYAYFHKDAPQILKALAEQEIAKYLSSVDIIKAMCIDRFKMISELKELIQSGCDRLGLGITIVSVNFLDSHPPTEQVAPSYEEVVGALEERETKILAAKKYEMKALFEAESRSYEIVMNAKAESESVENIAKAEHDRFLKQLDAYRAMPGMFRLRSYLDFFENDCKDVRKIVIGATIPHNVFILNLEEKARLDLLESDLVEFSDSKGHGGK